MDREGIGRAIRRDILRVARAGALAGSGAGFAGLLTAHGDATLAGATAARWTWLLVAALPLGFVAATVAEIRHAARSLPPGVPPDRLALVRVLLVIGLLGGTIGVVLEFVVAGYVPALFSALRLDVSAVRGGLVAGYPWTAVFTALGVTAAVAVLEAVVFPGSRRPRQTVTKPNSSD